MLQYITDRYEGLEDVLEGGCRWIQLRMKDADPESILTVGIRVGELCRRYGATFIIDDRVDLVDNIGADGVHLGQNDMAVDEARRILGSDKIIGATANTRDHIDKAVRLGADYIGLGPFRFTTTKKNLSPIIGLDGYRKLLSQPVGIPVVAIGGITLEDLPEIMATGVDGVAVSGLLSSSPSPKSTTESVVKIVGAEWER